MARQHGKITKGHTIPYGTLVGASAELRLAYYSHGYLHDKNMPELPCVLLEEEYIDPEEELFKKRVAVAIEEALEGATPRQKKVLCLRFGIGVTRDYTLEEIGVVLNVTKERVRQMETTAMRHMKHPSRGGKLMDLAEYPEMTEKVQPLFKKLKTPAKKKNIDTNDAWIEKLKKTKPEWNL